MALRASSGPTLSTRSGVVGVVVKANAKIENSATTDAHVSLFAEGSPHSIVFEPVAVVVPAKSRERVEFTWTASLPEGVDAKTLRGKLILRDSDSGRTVGEAPLDIYVSR